MKNHNALPNQSDRPFERMRTTSRQGSAFAQALPQGVAGLYLVAQFDDRGVHIEARERFSNGRGRLRNRRQARITLTANDASQLAAIMQEHACSQDQNNALKQALGATATDDLNRAEQRFLNVQRVARNRFAEIRRLHKQLDKARPRLKAAEDKVAEIELLQKKLAGKRSVVERVLQGLQTTIAAMRPIINQSSERHPVSGQSDRAMSAAHADSGGVTAQDRNEDSGDQFLEWLKQSIEYGSMPINTKDAYIHVLPEGLALVSPKIFQCFNSRHWSHVQKRFQKLQRHHKTPQGNNIWTCLVKAMSSFVVDSSISG